jgi:hypothetical protein
VPGPRQRGRQLRAVDHDQRLYRRHGELALARLRVTNGCADSTSGTSEVPQLADPLRATRKSAGVGQDRILADGPLSLSKADLALIGCAGRLKAWVRLGQQANSALCSSDKDKDKDKGLAYQAPLVRKNALGQPFRIRQCDEMATGNFLQLLS